MMNFKFLLAILYEYQLFIIKCFKATHFKNNLAQTKLKPHINFLFKFGYFKSDYRIFGD